MKALLMAGGFGTRIQPLTHSMPKPMAPLLNRPMMEHIIVRLQSVGITEIVVLLYYMPEVVKDYFGDGSKFGVKLEYLLPDDDYGTAGAAKCAEKFMDSTFMVMSGDLVTDFDLAEIISFHQKKKTPVTITLTSVTNPLQFGVVITDSQGKILRFLEKPGWGEVFSDTVNTGIYVLEPEVFNLIPKGSQFDFSKDLFPLFLKQETPIYGFNAKGYWRDVGDPDSYREVMRDILEGKVKMPLAGKQKKYPQGTVWTEGRKTDLPSDMKVKGIALLGKGVKIGGGVTLENVSLGDNCSIANRTRLQNSTLWDRVSVGSGAKLCNVVLCNDVEVGKNVSIENGAVIAEGTEVGDGARFEKDIMVWPNKKIEAKSVLSANMVWGDKWKKSVFEGGSVQGQTNVELPPEFAAKLGAALGSIVPRESFVLVGRDYLKASRMLKRAFLGGLLSTGVNVHDTKMLPVPVLRYKLASFGEVAGVYFEQSPSGSRNTEIVFYDEDGNLINTSTEKSIERLFFKENFRRVDHSEVGGIQELYALEDFYREGFIQAIESEAVRAGRFKVVLDLGNGTTGGYLPSLLNSLGCQTIVLNAYPDEKRLMRRMSETHSQLRQIGDIVTALNADVGFYITPGGQNLRMVDNLGQARAHHETQLFILKLLALTSSSVAKAFLPVAAPRVLDEKEPGVRITRGKTASLKTSLMHDFAFISEARGKYAFPSFLHASDAMFASAKILEMLSKAEVSVSDVFESLPKFEYVRREIPCPIESKGLVMRRMSEDSVDKEASFVDGVHVAVNSAGVLLVPDPFRPAVHLVVEGDDAKEVNQLTEEYEAKTRDWIGA